MRTILALLRDSRKRMILAILAGVVSGASHAGLLALINSALQHERPSDEAALGWAFLALCVAVPLARVASESIMQRLSENAIFDLRTQLSRRILAAPMRVLERIGPDRLLAAFNNDISAVVGALAFLPILAINLSIVAGSLAYLGWLSWPLLVATLAFMAAGVISYTYPMKRAQSLMRQSRQQYNTLYKHYRDLNQGVKELKLHAERRAGFQSHFAGTAGSMKTINVSFRWMFSLANSYGQLLYFLLVGFLLFVASGWLDLGRDILIGYSLIILYMRGSLQVLMERMSELGRASIAISQLEGLGISLDEKASEAPATGRTAAPGWSRLELRGVEYAYREKGQEDRFALGPLDLTFDEGEIIFLVGGNGSGKTTLAKLIVGLYTPDRGELLFGGETVNDSSRDAYRQHFSVVFSDFHLFESLLGLDAPDLDERAAGFLQQLHLDRKISIQDGKISSLDLSQGQRKRLALLTAYLEDRPIYLFDEWAADQDPEFKSVYYDALLPQLKARGKTVFVISHDDRYYGVADRVVKLENGRITSDRARAHDGRGPHHEG